MSAFFSNIFRWPPRPYMAVKSFFADEVLMELDDWMAETYGYYYLRLIGGKTEKELRKGVREVLKYPKSPAGIIFLEHWEFNKWDEDEIVTKMLAGHTLPIWYPLRLVPSNSTLHGVLMEQMQG